MITMLTIDRAIQRLHIRLRVLIMSYRPLSRRLDRCDRVIQKESGDPNGGICVRFHGRRVRHVYVTMQITFLARKSALIYRRGLRQRVASLTIDCNGVSAIRAYMSYIFMGLQCDPEMFLQQDWSECYYNACILIGHHNISVTIAFVE